MERECCKMYLSVIVPCYKSSKTLDELVKLTSSELNKIGVEQFEFCL